MQIFIKTINNESMALDVEPSDCIANIKNHIESQSGSSRDQQHLVFGGKQLHDGRTLSDYDVRSQSTLHLVRTPRGGHCQVPCGIFDDPKLVAEIKEACATIRKAMVKINELSVTLNAMNINQMTRWVNTKEEHCGQIIKMVSEYCLCQRVKPEGVFATQQDYVDALLAHHAVLTNAMKAKQTVDVAQC